MLQQQWLLQLGRIASAGTARPVPADCHCLTGPAHMPEVKEKVQDLAVKVLTCLMSRTKIGMKMRDALSGNITRNRISFYLVSLVDDNRVLPYYRSYMRNYCS